jgi:glycosidase
VTRKGILLRRIGASLLLAIMAQASAVSAQSRRAPHAYPWYVTAAAIHRVSLKPNTEFWRFEHLSLDPAGADRQLRTWKEDGIDSIELFAPEEGGNSFDGLDTKDRYSFGSKGGTIIQFRRLISSIHAQRMHVVTFQNLGYSATDDKQFKKAEQDVREGKQSRESRFFFWSDSSDAPPPTNGDSYFFLRPIKPHYDAMKKEFWQRSEPSQHFYWTKWAGKDEQGAVNHLPQYNWISDAWPTEARHVIDFWMSTGLDGMIVDAVNWYTGYDWQKNARMLAEYRKFGKDKLLLPEGGGAFHTDDPVGWIKDGTWPALYDYGLDIWWEEQSRPMRDSIQQGNPAVFEDALRKYHDRVVAAGGALIQPVLDMHDEGKQRLEESLLATSGDMLCYCEPANSIIKPATSIPELLRLKTHHPALYQNSTRRRIATDHDETVYATVRDAADQSERILVVFNFSSEPIHAAIDTRAVAGAGYRDLEASEPSHPAVPKLEVDLPGFGHKIFQVQEPHELQAGGKQ